MALSCSQLVLQMTELNIIILTYLDCLFCICTNQKKIIKKTRKKRADKNPNSWAAFLLQNKPTKIQRK